MRRIMVMAGGSGGHAMPALAVAECLRELGHEVLWVGAAAGLEAKLAHRAGFDFISLRIKGMRGGGVVRVVSMPLRLAWAMLRMLWVIMRRRPHVVLGMGGFIAGPGGLVAALLRRPLVIHEQNSVAGLTNRHLARFAVRVLSGFPHVVGLANPTWVGNPVRREILNLPPPEQRRRHGGALRLLVIGGSQGAQVFNHSLPTLLKRQPGSDIEIWHQCGHANAAAISARYRAAGLCCQVNDFIDDMAHAYAWCDLIICRAGAMSIAEICAAGVASILVPYPHAVNDHQRSNADYLQAHNAAYLVAQKEFLQGDWLALLSEFQQQPARLLARALAARRLAPGGAAEAVARACVEASDA